MKIVVKINKFGLLLTNKAKEKDDGVADYKAYFNADKLQDKIRMTLILET